MDSCISLRRHLKPQDPAVIFRALFLEGFQHSCSPATFEELHSLVRGDEGGAPSILAVTRLAQAVAQAASSHSVTLTEGRYRVELQDGKRTLFCN